MHLVVFWLSDWLLWSHSFLSVVCSSLALQTCWDFWVWQRKPPISRGCPVPVLTMVSSLLCGLLEYPLLLGAAESAEAHYEGSNILGGSSEDKKPSSTRGFTDAGFQPSPAPGSPIPCPRITQLLLPAQPGHREANTSCWSFQYQQALVFWLWDYELLSSKGRHRLLF